MIDIPYPQINAPYHGMFDPKLLLGRAWGAKIAILDSGVSLLKDKVSARLDFTETGIDPTVFHGDKVTEILMRYAKGAQFYSLKVGNEHLDELAMIRAIEWSVENKMDVINISSEFIRKCAKPCPLCTAVEYAHANGVIVVVAAGNRGREDGRIACPARSKKAVTVGALDQDMKVAEYSSRGVVGQNKPNILAPGFHLYNHDLISGTSFAAPVVAGVLASFVKSSKGPNEAINLLYRTAHSIGQPIHIQGNGAVDIKSMLGAIDNEATNSHAEEHEYFSRPQTIR